MGWARAEDMESIIGIAVALALGIFLGYKWRDRISQQRRAKYLAALKREQSAALGATKSSMGDSTG